jgi:hypothetical protein
MFEKSSCRDGGKPVGFCHGQHVFVFVKHSKAQRHIELFPRRAPPYQPLTGLQHSIGCRSQPVQSNLPMFQTVLPLFF